MFAGRDRLFINLFCVLLLALAPELMAGPPVAETDPLTPQEQQTKFKLPPGFEIQLVAAEPDIQKPMNLAFDARGRLWVTHSIEYPWAVDDAEKSRDALTVLDGIGPDGKATKVTKFADKVNIPIGVLPMPNGRDTIVWSIPYIWKFSDTDGDGTADKREILYGPFDYVDTHGDQNAFRLGNDGWIYACHGFRNSSKIKLRGEGPVVLEMNSGNTYRFKADGSAIEQLSWGQVNPFGQFVDARGDRYTADCHSKPVTMILTGGYYDSFGKPDDGLGFAPITTSNDHGSTGIAGIVSYDAGHFPQEFYNSMFVGNVVTNIVHRDHIEWRGSSPWVKSVEDFLTTTDWWFHPVDVQLGPDGALYIADFYNSIIGHYEVDLKHPRRDRHRGRIWRIVYTGTGADKKPAPVPPNLHEMPLQTLVGKLSDSNITVRNLASFELEARFGAEALQEAKKIIDISSLDARLSQLDSHARVLSMWMLWRAGELELASIERLSKDVYPVVRNQSMRLLGELPEWHSQHAELVLKGLKDQDPFVRRSAAESIARHPAAAHLQPLTELWMTTSPDDVQLVHAARIAIRNQLRTAAAVEKIASIGLKPDELARIVDIALAVPTDSAAWFTFDYIRQHEPDLSLVERSLRHVARYVSGQKLDEVARYVQQKFPNDTAQQASMFQSLFAGLTQRGAKLSADSELGRWGSKLANTLLDPKTRQSTPWENHALSTNPASASPWGVRHRGSADGKEGTLFFDSIVHGEQLTGVLTSAPFKIPETLTFWMCGHNGFPDKNPPPVNHVRLKLLESGDIIATEKPPRDDVAKKYTWDLKKWAGQEAIFEAVDADTGEAYAWLGVGRFEPAVVVNPVENFAFVDSSLVTAVQVANQMKLTQLSPSIIKLLLAQHADTAVRMAAAQASLNLDQESGLKALIAIVQSSQDTPAVRILAAQLLGPVNTPAAHQALAAALSTASGPLQQPIALALASSPEGGELLFKLIGDGKASARLLQDKPVLERLKGVKIADKEARIEALTQGLAAPDERLKQLAARLARSIPAAGGSTEAGAAVFRKTCAACHRIGGEGGKVGPQLDGVGIRGLDRILEDVLDPNRNVDAAFRAINVAKSDGVVVTGLKLREEGGAMIVGDSQGKEVRIPLSDIDEAKITNLSPMPSNITEQLNEGDLRALVTYLLSLKQKPAE